MKQNFKFTKGKPWHIAGEFSALEYFRLSLGAITF